MRTLTALLAGVVACSLHAAPLPGELPAPKEAPGIKEIYSTFSRSKTVRYDGFHVQETWGPDFFGGQAQWLGMPSTPPHDALVTKIQLALIVMQGTNELSVSLRDDDEGVPGNALRTFKITNVRTKRRCCSFEVVGPDIPVFAGHQYWVDVRAGGDTFAGWNLDVTNASGLIAFNDGNGWMTFDTLFSAFRVLGYEQP